MLWSFLKPKKDYLPNANTIVPTYLFSLEHLTCSIPLPFISHPSPESCFGIYSGIKKLENISTIQ